MSKIVRTKTPGDAWATTVEPEGGDAGTVSMVTVPVSSAELKALLASPKTLVEAPDSDELVLPIYAITQYLPGAAPYTYAGGSGLVFGWLGSALNSHSGYGLGTFSAGGFTMPLLDTVAAVGFNGFPQKDYDNRHDATSSLVGQPFIVTMDANEVADGDGSLVIVFLYTIVTLS